MIDRQVGSLGAPDQVTDYSETHGEFECPKILSDIKTKGVSIHGNRSFLNTDGKIETPVIGTSQKVLKTCPEELKPDNLERYRPENEMAIPPRGSSPFILSSQSIINPGVTQILFDFVVPTGRTFIGNEITMITSFFTIGLRLNIQLDGANFPYAQDIPVTASRFPFVAAIEENHRIKGTLTNVGPGSPSVIIFWAGWIFATVFRSY